jgi:hypothetical protein
MFYHRENFIHEYLMWIVVYNSHASFISMLILLIFLLIVVILPEYFRIFFTVKKNFVSEIFSFRFDIFFFIIPRNSILIFILFSCISSMIFSAISVYTNLDRYQSFGCFVSILGTLMAYNLFLIKWLQIHQNIKYLKRGKLSTRNL